MLTTFVIIAGWATIAATPVVLAKQIWDYRNTTPEQPVPQKFLGHASWVKKAAKKGHNATDYECVHWAGDVSIIVGKSAAEGDVLKGRAGIDPVTERRCIICNPRTIEEENEVLHFPFQHPPFA